MEVRNNQHDLNQPLVCRMSRQAGKLGIYGIYDISDDTECDAEEGLH